VFTHPTFKRRLFNKNYIATYEELDDWQNLKPIMDHEIKNEWESVNTWQFVQRAKEKGLAGWVSLGE